MKRRQKIILIIAICFIVCIGNSVSAQESSKELEKAKESLQTGNYLEARGLFRSLLENASKDNQEQVLGYFETFLALGEYNKGIDEIKSYLNKTPDNPYLLYMKGSFLKAVGKYKDAEQSFIDAQKIKGDFLLNLIEIGDLLEKTGRKRYAYKYYKQITSEYQQNRLRTAQSIGIAGKAFAKLGDFHEANRVFKIAYELDPKNLRTLYWWADLFREKFNNADAQRTFEEAISINPHSAELYVGYAGSFESLSQWEALVNKAIEENPNCVDALNILAEIQILDGNYNEAEEILHKALEINPVYEQSLGNLASIYHFRNDEDKFTRTEQKIQGINPQCSDFYITLAENCIRRFRYKDAVSYCRKAISKEFDNWHAYALLGSNILRIGQVGEARSYLEKGFNGDPFDIYARNTLELIDDYKDFESSESEHFSLLIHKSEKAVLAGPVLALAEECYDSLSIRYPYHPEHKIRIEAYNDHDDFAVRISGLPGIGLLGVCFGDVVAFDTPKAQSGSEYNWSSTLWHELAHVMSLGISDNKVPRWFTEGLSVYEEKLARPEWERRMELELFVALDQNLLLSLQDINKGFTRPKFSEQIMLAYYQSEKLIEFIVKNYGFNVIIELLAEFKKESKLENAFQTVLKETPEDVEKKFFDNLRLERDKYAPILSGLPPIFSVQKDEESSFEKLFGKSENPFFKNVKDGNELLNKGELDDAEKKFLKAIEIFPNYTGQNNPYLGLIKIYREKREESKLIHILENYLSISNYGAEEARELAQIYDDKGNPKPAEYYYKRSMQVDPYDLNTHTRLAELYEKQGFYSSETEERRVILALNPLDRAKVYYYLALSLYNNRNASDAKMEVLRSLDLAPGYREAQKLLLKCIEKKNE